MGDFDKRFNRLDSLLDCVETLMPGKTMISTEPEFSAYR